VKISTISHSFEELASVDIVCSGMADLTALRCAVVVRGRIGWQVDHEITRI